MQLLITQFSGAGLVPRRHRFEPRYVYDRLVEGSVALGWVIRVELRLCLSVPIHRSSTPIHQLPTPYNLCCWQHPLVNKHARSSYILHYFLTATREGDAHVLVLSLCVVQCELLNRSADVQTTWYLNEGELLCDLVSKTWRSAQNSDVAATVVRLSSQARSDV